MIDLTPHQEIVLSYLEGLAEEGKVVPRIGQIAEETGVGESTVTSIILALDRRGLIHLTRHRTAHKGARNLWAIEVTIARTGKKTAPIDTREIPTLKRAEIHGAVPCFKCGCRPDVCECGRKKSD